MQLPSPRLRLWWLAPAWVVTLVALGLWGLRPPPALPADAPPDRFAAERAFAALESVLDGVGPHPTGTAAAAEVRRRLIAHLEGLGYAPEIATDTVCNGNRCATVRNIVALRPGTDPDAPLVLVNTHYDSVPAGPGASDSGSGIAAELELARLLKERPTRAGVLFLLNEGEETNLLGAIAFMRSPIADRVGSVINLEARGTHGRALLFETSGPSGPVTRRYAAHARHPSVSSLYVQIYRLLPNGTDLGIFAAEGVPGANFAFVEGGHLYHTALDDLEHLDRGTLQHVGEQALAAVLGFAERPDLGSTSEGDDVTFDVLGLFVVSWPGTVTAPLSIGLAMVFLVVTAALMARGHTKLWKAGAGLGLAVLVSALCVVLAWGVDGVLSGLGASWHAVPWPFRTGVWGLVLAIFALSSLAVRRIGVAGTWIGVGAVFCIASLLLTWALPGGSYLVLVPALVAVVPMLAAAFSTKRAEVVVAAALAPLGGLLLVHLALGLETALGASGITIAGPLALGLLPTLPLLVDGPGRRVVGGLGAITAALCLGTLLAPARTASAPGGVSLTYAQQGDRAWWSADDESWPRSGLLPSDWPTPTALVRGQPATPIPSWEVAEPRVEVLDRSAQEVRFLLSSPRGAFQVGVELPRGTREVRIAGRPTPFHGGGVVWFHGETLDGVEVVLTTEGELPEVIPAFDLGVDLPPDPLPWPPDAVPIQDGVTSLRIVEASLLLAEPPEPAAPPD